MPFRFKIIHILSSTYLLSLTSACTQQQIQSPEKPKNLLLNSSQTKAPSIPSSIEAPTQQKQLSRNQVITQKKTKVVLPVKLHKISHNDIQFNIVTFDDRTQSLTVVDEPNGPGSLYSNSQAAAKPSNGIAAINAGFFTPEGKPLGLVITNTKKRGSYNTSSLGSGMYYLTKEGAKISRRSIWNTLSKTPPTELLQSGPMLIERSKTVAGLSNKEARVRSFIATDGNNHWCIGHAGSCTLKELSNALQSLKIDNFKLQTALNLDGGRSSDLWVASTVTNGPTHIRPFWNKDVRNFLVLKNK